MNKRSIYLVLTLLFAVIAAFISLRGCNKQTKQRMTTNLQGETILSAGPIKMKVWDNEAEDGDSIRVYFRDELLADSLEIRYKPMIYALGDLKKGEYELRVEAIYEGMSPPATPTVSLSDGKQEKEFVMQVKLDTAAAWKVVIR